MAMESGTDMAMESGHVAHASHSTEKAGPDRDCGHCPPAECATVMSCDVQISSACQPDVQGNLDSRRAKLILKDAQFDLPPGIARTITTTPFADHKIVPPGIYSVACLPGYQPPLNLLNCVYLI